MNAINKTKAYRKKLQKKIKVTVIRTTVIYGRETSKINISEKETLEKWKGKMLRTIYEGKTEYAGR